MKFRHLLVSLLAVAALSATSCQEEEKDLGLPEIKISQNELALDQGVGTTTLNVYATRNWTVSTTADWIAVNPSKGSAYTETSVTVTVLENEDYNRTGTVKFDIGYDSKTLTINQTGAKGEKSEGSGTVEDPYTVKGVIDYIGTLGTEVSPAAVYIKGKVQAITLTYAASGTYGNARFTMIDEGGSDPFTAYNVLYLGNKKWATGQDDIKEGDEVIVCSKVYNYNGKTPETSTGGYLYSLNGVTGGGAGDEAKGTGTLEDPYNPAGIAAAVANLTWTSTTDYQTTDPVYVKGKISKIAEKGTYTEGGTYGNATFYITETGEETGTEFYVYRILYLNNKKFASGQTDIKKGDEVVIYGKMMNYFGNTPETASGCYLYSLNGETGGGGGGGDEAKGTGTLTDPYNPAGAAAAVANLTWTSNTEYQTTEDVYVKGKISKIANKGTYTDGGTYGNASFYITETGQETGTSFYCFRVLYLENKKFESGQTDIKKGDEVIILGKLMNYQGNTPETVSGKAYLYSLNGKTKDEGTGGGGDTSETYFSETFETSQGNFTIDNKTMPSELTYVWKHDATNKYMKASAYANSTKYATESWLISPEIDLSSAPSAFLSFDHVMRYFGTANQDGTLKVTIDNGANWTDVTIPTYPDGTSWTFVSSGEINLANYIGKKVKLAFIYKSSTDAAATWEIKNVKVYKNSTAGGGSGGGGDTGNTITVSSTDFTADTDATYGAGFKFTASNGVVVAYYKHTSSSNPVNTSSGHIRIYKGSVVVVTAPTGKTMKKLVFNTTDANYTKDLTVLEGSGSCTTNTSDVTWTGSAGKFVGHAAGAQVRISSIVVTME